MRCKHIGLLMPLLFAFPSGCRSVQHDRPLESHTLVFLHTGPRTGLTGEQQQAVFAGHMANMQRLARAGDLLLAGPYGRKKSDPTLRGVFVMTSADAAEARRLAETDPGFVEGVFRLEYDEFATDYPLRAMLAAELAAEDERSRIGRPVQPGEFGRGYVILTAAEGTAAESLWRRHPSVVLFARLGEGRAMAIVDAVDREALGEIEGLDSVGLGQVAVDEWFATRRLAEHRLPQGERGT